MSRSNSVLGYLGLGRSPTDQKEPHKSTKAPVRALPAAWYNTAEMYEFERRAIFSKRWLLVTHRSRLRHVGDFLRYKVAGYDFFLVVDRSNNINAFHNVCRHRAYTVVEKEEGRASILSCRYHGWSYGLNGKLAKAPDYDKLEGFDKAQNSLLPIHVYIDNTGFIHVNFDAKERPEVPWDKYLAGADTQERLQKFNIDDYQLDHVYELDANYNWKIASDNFNECYHCKTTHPDVPTFLTIDSHDVDLKDGYMEHDQAPTEEQKQQGFDCNSTYYFPNVSVTVSPHFMMIQKFQPVAASATKVHYEIYRNKNSSEKDFRAIAETYARVMGEDKVLCDRAQANINAGVFNSGELHPRWEKGPLHFQNQVREAVTEHFNQEKAAGRQIWPARPEQPMDDVSRQDMEICNGLGCGTQNTILAW